jgi:hypothetical protein
MKARPLFGPNDIIPPYSLGSRIASRTIKSWSNKRHSTAIVGPSKPGATIMTLMPALDFVVVSILIFIGSIESFQTGVCSGEPGCRESI